MSDASLAEKRVVFVDNNITGIQFPRQFPPAVQTPPAQLPPGVQTPPAQLDAPPSRGDQIDVDFNAPAPRANAYWAPGDDSLVAHETGHAILDSPLPARADMAPTTLLAEDANTHAASDAKPINYLEMFGVQPVGNDNRTQEFRDLPLIGPGNMPANINEWYMGV